MSIKQIEFEDEPPVLGINPLTLAIALVIITIILAAFLSFLASGIATKKSKEGMNCDIALFGLYSGYYEPSKSSLTFTLENLESSRISDMSLYVFYSDGTLVEKPIENDLGVGKMHQYTFATIPKGFEKVEIRTSCPDVKVEFIEQNNTLIEI